MSATATSLHIDRSRLLGRIDELARIGALPVEGREGGSSRLALTEADGAGRDLVTSWMRDLGLRVDIDGIGNVVGTWPADRFDPPVLTGSHIDTVATGGRYDGNLGVLAGLEVLETVIEAATTGELVLERPLAVGFFTNEEGSRFAPDMLGSLVYVRGLPLEEALDTVAIDGAILADELERIGYVGGMPCPARPPAAFVELHIEQGPVLESEGVTIGAVTGVQGISWQELTITGQSNHAGTTPIELRHDAGHVAAEVAVAVRRLARRTPGLVGTVGRVDLHPGLVNVVAARATITIDLRHQDGPTLAQAESSLAAEVAELAAAEGVDISWRRLARFEPVVFDPMVVDLVEQVATAHGHPVRRIASGAGHDAQMLARVCPAGMIFTPSVDGISHNPTEFTEPDDLEAGANILLDVILRLATLPPTNVRSKPASGPGNPRTLGDGGGS
ncbi:MAG: Zn-dependent hydrolase [Acidimicrobiales bacterium]